VRAAESFLPFVLRFLPEPRARVLDLSREAGLPGGLSRPHEGASADATAWVCTARSCLPPIHAPDALEEALAIS